MNTANYRKLNDRSLSSSTYHKKDGTAVRAKLAAETRAETRATLWGKERIQDLLATNDAAVIRALLVVYRNQTSEEQVAHQTVENNGVGFTGVDAELLTSYAQQYLRSGTLSPKQLAITRNKIKKYWRQLLAASAKKGHEVKYR